jgi:tetratricopeptide (TPR) repeat protein
MDVKIMSKVFSISLFLLFFWFGQTLQAQQRKSVPKKTVTNIIIKTQPNTIVWLDEVRRGVTDENGKLEIKSVSPKPHALRVRAKGFKETTVALATPIRSEVVVKLLQTTDEAELLFQQAEEAREKATNMEERDASAELYRRALKLRPNFPAAHVGLARVLSDLEEYEDALEEIKSARKDRLNYAEASAVEGRIYRAMTDYEAAIESFQRAIKEAKGYHPEAHTGLAFVYEDNEQLEDAAEELKTALEQLYDTEPLLYERLGSIYERLNRYKEAIAAYEKYLEISPNGKLAPAIKSIIEQLRKQ